MTPDQTDVLIVGAGPTGLMLANQLARRGVRFLIIDRHAGPSVQTKALGVHARTLEIYAKLGIANVAVATGQPTTAANLWANGRRSARVPLGDIGQGLSAFPYVLILGQDDNERLLTDALRAHGVAVSWKTELTALQQENDHVRCTLKKADGSSRSLRARWVAGCDGAKSAVRQLNHIDFPGAPYEHVFFVADTTATGPMVPEELNVYLMPDGFHLFFPMRGKNHWRVVGILPPELRGRDDVALDELAPSIRTHVGHSLNFSECRWLSTYRIHHRHAARFRDRRCFLLGDAAHIHSPVGAQGMNTGLQDAYNLGWKLALVVNGGAHERLLDSYEAERLPVARRLLRTTDRMFTIVVSNSAISRIMRARIMARIAALAMRFNATRQLAFLTLSQIGIQYRGSPLSETADLPRQSPQPGDRFPWMRLHFSAGSAPRDLFEDLDDTRFNLIVFGQAVPDEAPEQLADMVRIHRIPDTSHNDQERARANIPARAFYLLRPDGHIAVAGTDLDSSRIERYFAERVGLSRHMHGAIGDN